MDPATLIAHDELRRSGKLTGRKLAVLDALKGHEWYMEHYPGSWKHPTGAELRKHNTKIHYTYPLNSVRSALTELLREGLVRKGKLRECRVTGHVANEWHVVGEQGQGEFEL